MRNRCERSPILLRLGGRRGPTSFHTLRVFSMPFDIDLQDASFRPASLTVDHAAKHEAARQIANFESAQAEQIAERLETTDPVLSAAIRRELSRRATRQKPQRTSR